MAVSRKTASAKSSRRTTASREFADHWDLSDLVADPVKQFDRYLKDLSAKVARFEAARPDLSATMPEQSFLNLLTLSEQIARDSGRLGAYSYLWFSEDTKQLQARSFKTKVEEHLTTLQNRLLFFDLWWQSVDEKNAERLMANSGDFRYHLETIRRFKPHTLSEPEEKISNIKNITGQSAVHQLYDVVTNGFTFTLRVGGKKKTMNREALTAYLRSPKAGVREAAYREILYLVYTFARESALVCLAQQGFQADSARSVSPRCVFGVAALKALQHKAFSEATGVPWCVTSFPGVRGHPASQHRPLFPLARL